MRRARHKWRMFTCVLAVAFNMTAVPAHAGTIRAVDASFGAIRVTFDKPVGNAHVFSLAGPDRIALDIEGAEPGQAGIVTGPVRAVRQARTAGGGARVVFDLAGPQRITDVRYADDGRVLEVRYRAAEGDELLALDLFNRRDVPAVTGFRAAPPADHYSVSVPLGRPRQAAGLPRILGPDDERLPLVVLDAGHGGHDPGAISPHGGHREKDVTLAIAQKIRADLLKTGRVRVAMTRENDSFVVLQDRFLIARKLDADLFISLHADAAAHAEASGATVYTLSEVASDREAQRLAVRENKVNIINGIDLGGTSNDVSSILIDLTQRETMNISAGFAKLLLREAGANMALRSTSHRFASFVVLKAADTPSVLFETGYLTNEKDMAFLASSAGQNNVAKSVSAAVQAHFARRVASR